MQKVALLLSIFPWLIGTSARATELKPETIAAFERYARITEAQMEDDARDHRFLFIDRLPESQRREVYQQLQRGEFFIQELHTQEDHLSIRIPNGLIHHWAGAMFIPKGTLSEALAVLNDYENEPENFKPDIRRAKLIQQNGNTSKIYLQLYSKSIITVVMNGYFDVVETPLGSTRIESVSRSTRLVEVVNPGGPDEHERNDGYDHGYMWRVNSYWRIEEKDGGVYVQNESITLTRTVPTFLAWIINPLTKSIPHDVIFRMLTDTQNAVLKARTVPKQTMLLPGSPDRALPVHARENPPHALRP